MFGQRPQPELMYQPSGSSNYVSIMNIDRFWLSYVNLTLSELCTTQHSIGWFMGQITGKSHDHGKHLSHLQPVTWGDLANGQGPQQRQSGGSGGQGLLHGAA